MYILEYWLIVGFPLVFIVVGLISLLFNKKPGNEDLKSTLSLLAIAVLFIFAAQVVNFVDSGLMAEPEEEETNIWLPSKVTNEDWI
jgi:hypothetical protein